jgi:hypothetical protein
MNVGFTGLVYHGGNNKGRKRMAPSRKMITHALFELSVRMYGALHSHFLHF